MSERIRGKIKSISEQGVTAIMDNGEERLFDFQHETLFSGFKEGDGFELTKEKSGVGAFVFTVNKIKDNLDFRIELEEFVIEYLEKKWNCTFVHTEKDSTKSASYSPIDGFMIRDKKIVAMIENRSRKEKQ
ncbi:MAG: hypothetical protein QXO70_03990 [Candidatus Pacearchaeota archaeon]